MTLNANNMIVFLAACRVQRFISSLHYLDKYIVFLSILSIFLRYDTLCFILFFFSFSSEKKDVFVFLIQEQGKVRAHFKTDDKDEIKKQYIEKMRKNNMRMRLKSMFVAISGKCKSYKLN